MPFSMRVSLPDVPGALAAMCRSLAEGECDVVTLEVVERADGYAVDDLVLEAPGRSPEAVRAVAESAADVIVEAVTPVDGPRRPEASLELAALLSVGEGDALETLATGLPGAMWASWAMVVEDGVAGPEVLSASPQAPRNAQFATPWVPLDRPRRLDPAAWMPPAWRMRAGAGTCELAAAPLHRASLAVLLGRSWAARFRPTELRQLGLLADLASVREVDVLVRS